MSSNKKIENKEQDGTTPPLWFLPFAKNMEILTANVNTLTTDVAVLKTDVAELKTDIALLKTDVADLKTDIAELRTDVTSLTWRVVKLETNFGELTTHVKTATTEIGHLSNRMGEFNESFVQDDVKALFSKRGMDVSRIDMRRVFKDPDTKEQTEVDILIRDKGKYVALDVKTFMSFSRMPNLDYQLGLLRRLLARDDDDFISVEGGVVCLHYSDDAAQKLIEQNFYVIKVNHIGMSLKNPRKFKPKLFYRNSTS
ncbi:MAG: hypothetical protein LBK06_08685 [Planctomycetaceae bacterium]|jgi:hypothetical protein|nr:hypothetical protein [Planctomycetaceae bacterium]